jgi:hypothetical protein
MDFKISQSTQTMDFKSINQAEAGVGPGQREQARLSKQIWMLKSVSQLKLRIL